MTRPGSTSQHFDSEHSDSQHWDLVIVGAGPAGSAAALGALTAAPDLRVLLLDRSDFPRDKTCGDGIATHVLDELARIGVRGTEDGWPPVRRLELGLGGTSVASDRRVLGWVIPRAVFDARLVDRAVAAGAVLRRHRVVDVEPSGDVVRVDDVASAAVVVGADGPYSVTRVAAGLPPTRRRALALRGYVPTPTRWEGAQVIRFGERRRPSYAWAFDRGDGLCNVGYGEVLGAEPEPPTRSLLLDELEHLLPGATDGGESWKAHQLPLSGWRWDQPDGTVLLAGDASGLVNPMTGEGIFYAVATGIRAGRAAASAIRAGDPGSAGGAYRGSVRRLLAGHLRHTSIAARLAGVPTVVHAGIRAASRDDRVLGDLVELGLGRGRITPQLAGGLLIGLVLPARRG
jgi:geranylgeranyl reductase family protein